MAEVIRILITATASHGKTLEGGKLYDTRIAHCFRIIIGKHTGIHKIIPINSIFSILFG